MGGQLVPVTQVTEGGAGAARGAARPLAGFVAQLIAGEQGLAGHRRRRRAAPEEASALYRAAQASAGTARPTAGRCV